jgi:hypothetical protein
LNDTVKIPWPIHDYNTITRTEQNHGRIGQVKDCWELYGLFEGARRSSSTDIVSQAFPGSGRRVRLVGMPWLTPGVSSAVTLGDIIFPFIAPWRGF